MADECTLVPLNARPIAKLGDALDVAEIDELENDELNEFGFYCGCPCDECWEAIAAIRHRRYRAETDYRIAISARHYAAYLKFKNSNRVPTVRGVSRLYNAEMRTRQRLQELYQARNVGWEFCSAREIADAEEVAKWAASKLEIAQEKFQDAERKARADDRAVIVRVQYRRKPHEVHL
jgi:hypothetical protein